MGFVTNFEGLMKDYKRMELLNLSNLSSRQELNANVTKALESGIGVTLHRVDRLRGDAPQVLHGKLVHSFDNPTFSNERFGNFTL